MGLGVSAREGPGDLALKVDSAAKSMRGEWGWETMNEWADNGRVLLKKKKTDGPTEDRESSVSSRDLHPHSSQAASRECRQHC